MAVLAVIWGGAVALGLAAARLTKVGPILLASGRHGVHTGDVVAFAFAFTVAAVCTAAFLYWDRWRGERTSLAEAPALPLTGDLTRRR